MLTITYFNNFDIERFVRAQDGSYQQALKEIKEGCKKSHWMWYIFPQVDGLGYSPFAKKYAIKNLKEATNYINHPALFKNLVEISNALLDIPTNDITDVMPYPDNMKLKSSMTLFVNISDNKVFQKVLDKYYNGERCEFTEKTLKDWKCF